MPYVIISYGKLPKGWRREIDRSPSLEGLSRYFLFYKRYEVAISLFFHILKRDEAERGAVDAVTEPSSVSRPVGENMSEMSVTRFTTNLHSFHAVGGVAEIYYEVGRNRLREGRPSASGIILVGRKKEGLTGSNIDIDAGAEFMVVFISEGALGGVVLCDFILQGREPRFEFSVRGTFIYLLRLSRYRWVATLGSEAEESGIDVAISSRVLIKIVLVIVFGGIEIFDGKDFNSEGHFIFFLQGFEAPSDDRELLGRGEIYAGAILRADVVTLAIE